MLSLPVKAASPAAFVEADREKNPLLLALPERPGVVPPESLSLMPLAFSRKEGGKTRVIVTDKIRKGET